MRLDKAMTLAGYTRSKAKAMIAKGRVTVDGTVVCDSAKAVAPGDVYLDGAPIDAETELYIMLHKPQGVVTATEDRHFPTVVSLLPEKYRRRKIGPVGRLDKDVTGLVLLTTNGQLAHRLISPKWKAEKCYRAECEGRLTENDVLAFENGIELKDFTCQPAKMQIISAGEGGSVAEVILTEGKYHQVKRMFAAIGHPLNRLMRLRIGCVTLDETLKVGEYRSLTPEEIRGLKAMSDLL